MVFTFIALLTFILSQEKKQKGLFCLVLVFGLKNRCTTSVWLPFYDCWKEILHNCSKGFSQKPMILHNRSVGFASWFQQSCNASLVHFKKIQSNKTQTNIVPKKVWDFFQIMPHYNWIVINRPMQEHFSLSSIEWKICKACFLMAHWKNKWVIL